ncbi:hypothetical protein C1645_835517 [Glomus cerebriforme]|uniref:Uncharacterized protein n=1 Tax=Glomus cerebriforme TaxID=658196 RepID=A0A397SHT0_9GLOM|nr:hypothetical protein C1645_835517 [Glomus cerebriforme]
MLIEPAIAIIPGISADKNLVDLFQNIMYNMKLYATNDRREAKSHTGIIYFADFFDKYNIGRNAVVIMQRKRDVRARAKLTKGIGGDRGGRDGGDGGGNGDRGGRGRGGGGGGRGRGEGGGRSGGDDSNGNGKGGDGRGSGNDGDGNGKGSGANLANLQQYELSKLRRVDKATSENFPLQQDDYIIVLYGTKICIAKVIAIYYEGYDNYCYSQNTIIQIKDLSYISLQVYLPIYLNIFANQTVEPTTNEWESTLDSSSSIATFPITPSLQDRSRSSKIHHYICDTPMDEFNNPIESSASRDLCALSQWKDRIHRVIKEGHRVGDIVVRKVGKLAKLTEELQ